MTMQQEVDALIDGLVDELPPAVAAQALALLVNRAVARLHNLARAEANARKDKPDWPAWAQLQNASRALVLQASTSRDLANRIVGLSGPQP